KVNVEIHSVDEEHNKPSARLQGDLISKTIDFLYIVFCLERKFGIRIPRDELFPESIYQADPEFVQEGKVTDQGIGELRSRMPYVDLKGFDHDRQLSSIPDLFTVDLIARYVAWKLDQRSGLTDLPLSALARNTTTVSGD